MDPRKDDGGRETPAGNVLTAGRVKHSLPSSPLGGEGGSLGYFEPGPKPNSTPELPTATCPFHLIHP